METKVNMLREIGLQKIKIWHIFFAFTLPS